MTKRILLTGGGTGGHIFPLIAVADEIKKLERQKVQLFYIGPKHPLNEAFKLRNIKVRPILSSKWRRYFDLRNFLDVPKFFLSFVQALYWLYFIMPDLVFSKGGPGALAVILAAKFYFIPVLIHDSDSIPGLTNRLSAHFAEKIFIAFTAAEKYFSPNKIELVGNPIRTELFLNRPPSKEVAKAKLNFNPDKPLILFLTGSQGARRINSFVFDNLEELLKLGQVLHQVGEKNITEAAGLRKEGYKFKGFFNSEELKLALVAADVVISRAGGGAIFEIAAFHKPSILIPLPEAASDHQRLNAYEYARTGAAVVIEENNLSWGIIKIELEKILNNPKIMKEASQAARNFAKPEAAETIAKEILKI